MANDLWLSHFRSGTAANRPDTPDFGSTSATFGYYYATDTDVLSFATAGSTTWRSDNAMGVTEATTSSTAAATGVTVSATTGAASYTLAAPVAGARKELVLNSTSTSTAARTWTLVSGNFQSTASSTYTTLTLNGSGQFAELTGISTSRWQVRGLSAAAVLA